MRLSLKTRTLNAIRSVFKIKGLEEVLVRLSVNRSPDSLVARAIPNHYQYSKGTFRFTIRNGINYKVDLHDYIDWWVYFGLIDAGKRKLYELVERGSTVIDAGTNVGETLMTFSRLTGPEGRVFGFEPDSVNYKRCTDNLALNEFTNLSVANIGLGNETTTVLFKVKAESHRGRNRVTASRDESSESIDLIRLDDFVAENGLTKIALMKIDVEGYELNVLMGAEQVLARDKPRLFVELDDDNLKEQGHSARAVVRFLRTLGYDTRNARSGAIVDEAMDFSHCHCDIICVPAPSHAHGADNT